MVNKLLLTDSYKVSHWRQYDPKTTHIYSFYESRGGRWDETVFFGLQYMMKKHLEGRFVNSRAEIDEAEAFFEAHFGTPGYFNRAGWEYLLDAHDGRLPIEIRAVPEGSVIPTSNALMTVVNTDSQAPWVTNYLETLLAQVWYPCTVATNSREMKKVISEYLRETGTDGDTAFKLHDFGYRGSTTDESAGIGGAAHLVNFQGTDTLAGIVVARDYYGEPMAGFSVAAAEHSTVTAWGREGEVDAYRHMLREFPNGLLSVVSDSYDIFSACQHLWGETLRSEVLARDGVLVVRPDSGDPPMVVRRVLEILYDKFGGDTNEKGYKVLNPKVRVIQGDGIDYNMLGKILGNMKAYGFSADNIVFGSGGGLLQQVNRDTCKFAFKCSATMIDGQWRDVIKTPVTDPDKNSKGGRLALINDNGRYRTARKEAVGFQDLLVPVFRNGVLVEEQSFGDIRERASLDAPVLTTA